jgi:hypothetical protein
MMARHERRRRHPRSPNRTKRSARHAWSATLERSSCCSAPCPSCARGAPPCPCRSRCRRRRRCSRSSNPRRPHPRPTPRPTACALGSKRASIGSAWDGWMAHAESVCIVHAAEDGGSGGQAGELPHQLVVGHLHQACRTRSRLRCASTGGRTAQCAAQSTVGPPVAAVTVPRGAGSAARVSTEPCVALVTTTPGYRFIPAAPEGFVVII